MGIFCGYKQNISPEKGAPVMFFVPHLSFAAGVQADISYGDPGSILE